jgi:hypothetical protein
MACHNFTFFFAAIDAILKGTRQAKVSEEFLHGADSLRGGREQHTFLHLFLPALYFVTLFMKKRASLSGMESQEDGLVSRQLREVIQFVSKVPPCSD